MLWSINLHTRSHQCMGTNRDITSVQKSTICIHKYVFTQTYTIPMIAMERRAHNGCLGIPVSGLPTILCKPHRKYSIAASLPATSWHIQTLPVLRGRHIRQLRTTHFLYFIHIFQLPDYTLKSVIIPPFTITLSTKIDIYSKQPTILIKRNSKYFQKNRSYTIWHAKIFVYLLQFKQKQAFAIKLF